MDTVSTANGPFPILIIYSVVYVIAMCPVSIQGSCIFNTCNSNRYYKTCSVVLISTTLSLPLGNWVTDYETFWHSCVLLTDLDVTHSCLNFRNHWLIQTGSFQGKLATKIGAPTFFLANAGSATARTWTHFINMKKPVLSIS